MFSTIYIVWYLIPVFFFVIALWSKLEHLSGKNKRDNPADFFKQGLFVTACVIAAILIDKFLLQPLVPKLAGDLLPLGFFQVLLLPVVLYLAARIVGPSKAIRITKAPRPSERKRR